LSLSEQRGKKQKKKKKELIIENKKNYIIPVAKYRRCNCKVPDLKYKRDRKDLHPRIKSKKYFTTAAVFHSQS